MRDDQLSQLLKSYYPDFLPVQFPGADQQRYADLVRSAIREAAGSAIRPVMVLDFGCGRGATPICDFKATNVRVCGVDVDSAAMQNPYVDEFKVSSHHIDYADGTFDLVCSAYVFEHLAEPEIALSEVHRVLKIGGKLVFLTPNAYSLISIAARLTPHRLHVWLNSKRGVQGRDVFPVLYRLNTLEGIRSAARRAGFKIDMLEYWEGRPEYLFFIPLTFYLGLAWERCVNSLPFFRALRASLFGVLTRIG